MPHDAHGSATTPWIVGLTLAAGTGHVVYPATLGAWATLRGAARRGGCANGAAHPPFAEVGWPDLGVVVPAYREAASIEHKIEGLRADGYPGALDIVVVAEDRETADAARRLGVRVIESERRLGKSQAVNLGVERSTAPFVVVTDANNDLAPGSLVALVAHFADPAVGGVAGAKSEDGEGEALYWRFESWLKQRESDLGTTLGMVGELFAVRAAAWRPIPHDIGSDDLWTALDLAERGYRVRYERDARSIERSASAEVQWERRTRIGAMALHVFVRKAHLLHPRRGLLAFQIVGHKLWRSTVGPVAHVVLLALSVRACRRNPVARAVLAAHALGGASLVLQRRGARLPRPVVAGCQMLYLQLVALGGIRRFVRGQHSPIWLKQPR